MNHTRWENSWTFLLGAFLFALPLFAFAQTPDITPPNITDATVSYPTNNKYTQHAVDQFDLENYGFSVILYTDSIESYTFRADTGALDVEIASTGLLSTNPLRYSVFFLNTSHVSIPDGIYPITVFMADGAGNESSVELLVIVDNEPPSVPSLTIIPPDGHTSLQNGDTFTIEGLFTDVLTPEYTRVVGAVARQYDINGNPTGGDYGVFGIANKTTPFLNTLSSGPFSVTLDVTSVIGDAPFEPNATSLVVELVVDDGAQNRTTVQSEHIPVNQPEPDPEPAGASSVLFLPGFLGSRLYTDQGELHRSLWEPNGSDDIRDLAMNADGTSKLPVYVGDIIENYFGIPLAPSVYGAFMNFLSGLVQEGKIAAWEGYPYDWRYDVFDVVDNGALKQDGSHDFLIPLVEDLAATSYTGKVTIIGHSNGGLLAKALMTRLKEEGKEGLVDKVIFIASPEIGTPQALLGLLHGQNIITPFIAPPGVARASATTMPGAYGLLPSEAYFGEILYPLPATFAEGEATESYRVVFGDSVVSMTELTQFLVNSPFTRPVPTESDVATPLPLSFEFVTKAADTHDILDSWAPPPSVEVHEIAGWGNGTVASARYVTKTSFQCPSGLSSCGTYSSVDVKPVLVSDGDDTVISPSASFLGSGVYFDLFKLKDDFDESHKHENITESPKLHQYVDFLLGTNNSFIEELFPTVRPENTSSNLIISVHSPIALSLTDGDGNETGIFPLPGSDLFYTKEGIPHSTVFFGGEGKYISVPASGTYGVRVEGTGSGTFTLIVEDENSTVIKEYKNLPVSPGTIATTEVQRGTVEPLMLDIDGDGTTDIVVTNNTLSKDGAVAYCRGEIGKVRTALLRFTLLALFKDVDNPRAKRLQEKAREKFLAYLGRIEKRIPPEQATALATCIEVLKNSE